MTRSQRRRHFVAWCLLGPALLAFLAAALAVRTPPASDAAAEVHP